MYRAFLFHAAAMAGLAIFLVAVLGGFTFLGGTISTILFYVGAIAVLVFGVILIILGIRVLLGYGQCNGHCNKPCKYCNNS
ncbi:hypothetical protein CIL05_05355 [Virgibacillus profundi]|uniref:Uncharacterized protein n=1 Tax=Virgibacillus profundi TaxID=2024555 RepID=A0A2A2IFI3_9BACI|nr:hypothetical protein [Virgibacillus profundi]PAV30529.1 hypothetical protein CIL05_05355 [Virgibacillus profundi]PXY54701.1 hypothetical protein CIT14_05440 [Virgibacillus profundi]